MAGSGSGWVEDFMSTNDWSGTIHNNITTVMGNFTILTENNTASTAAADQFQLTCEQRQMVYGFPLPLAPNIAVVLRYMQITFYFVCLPFGVLLNLFVTVLILRHKKLQNIPFFLALQVCAGDMINAAIVFPTSAANAIADRYVFTGFCTTIGFAVFYLRIVRIYLMLVLVLDRFCNVIMPFWYQRNKVKVIVPLSLTAWIWGFVISIIPVRGILDCYAFQRNTWACVPSTGCLYRNACSIYNTTSITLSNAFNVVGIVLYTVLFCKAKKLQKKVDIAPSVDGSGEEDTAALAQKLKRERRANTTFFILFLALVGINILPFTFFVVGRSVIVSLRIVPPPAYVVVGVISRSLFPLLTIMDPIVIMRNEDFKEVVRKLFNKLNKRFKLTKENGQNTTINNANNTIISGSQTTSG